MFVILSPFTKAKGKKNTKNDMRMSGNEGIYVCTPTLLPPTHLSCFALFSHSRNLFFLPQSYFLCILFVFEGICVCASVPASSSVGENVSILESIMFQSKESHTEAKAMIRQHVPLHDVTDTVLPSLQYSLGSKDCVSHL